MDYKNWKIDFVSHGIMRTIECYTADECQAYFEVTTKQGKHPCVWYKKVWNKDEHKFVWTFGGYNNYVDKKAATILRLNVPKDFKPSIVLTYVNGGIKSSCCYVTETAAARDYAIVAQTGIPVTLKTPKGVQSEN